MATNSTPRIGQMIAGKGIFAGVWTPEDRDGQSLGKKFSVFAAPEDLTDGSGKKLVATFRDAAKRITALRNWHGHDGGDFANDTALYKGLADGSAIGKWFIPPLELLLGTDLDGNFVRPDNLYTNKNKGDFKGTFTTHGRGGNRGPTVWHWGIFKAGGRGSYDQPVCYWSCTESRYTSHLVLNTRFSDGDGDWDYKDVDRLSCRPCRVEAFVI
jgi:hypothetical protein